MSKNEVRIYLARHLPRKVEAALEELGPLLHPPGWRSATRDDLAEGLREADVLVCTVVDRLDPDLLRATPRRAGLIASFGVGVDHIPVQAALDAGVLVSNTPGVLTDTTADLTLALIMTTLRRLGEGERLARSGEWCGWEPTQLLGRDVTGRRLGIIGMGRIGSAVARRAQRGFEMEVRYYTPRATPPGRLDGIAATACSLEELLAWAEIVSIHCPATKETEGLMNRERLAAMAPGSILINTARGSIVDEEALIEALVDGGLAGAGLDVYAREPEIPPRLRALEQVVLLPHLGSATEEAREAMGRVVVENVRSFLRRGVVPNPAPTG